MSQANMSGKTVNMTATAVVRPLVLDPDRRTMIISDIHGNLPFLKGLLRKVGYTKDDVLIILGDILEKSVHGLETLHYLMELSRTNTVYFVQGNCEDVTLSFLRGSWPDEVCLRYGSMWGDKCAWVSMAHQVGMEIQDPKHYPAIRAAIEKQFPEELEFLRAMPQILVNDDYLLVHGGVPRETDLEHLNAHNCMKNDNFLNQGYAFRRWVVVGHWPVSLYHRHVPTSRPPPPGPAGHADGGKHRAVPAVCDLSHPHPSGGVRQPSDLSGRPVPWPCQRGHRRRPGRCAGGNPVWSGILSAPDSGCHVHRPAGRPAAPVGAGQTELLEELVPDPAGRCAGQNAVDDVLAHGAVWHRLFAAAGCAGAAVSWRLIG